MCARTPSLIMNRLQAILKSTRPPFLILSVVSTLLGAATAFAELGNIALAFVAIVFLAAISAHASVNLLNEYLDFRSGIDLHTERTAFSGGSGGLPRNPQSARSILHAGIAALLMTLLCGGILIYLRGPILVLPGILGVFLILAYTSWLNQRPWLCLIAPGTGIGFCVMLGTHLALGGSLSATALLAAALLFALCNNLLLLNQYPDLNADAQGGRRHLIIAHGIGAGNAVYLGMLLLAMVTLATGIRLELFPQAALLCGIPLAMMAISFYGALRHRQGIGKHPMYLALNVVAVLLAPTLLAGVLIHNA
jgi:1,4-dihydroxy-2-naphthoate octaprenyltransferase